MRKNTQVDTGFMLICWAAGWWLDKKKIYIMV